MEETVSTGLLGESIACRYLIDRGFRIVTRNFLRKGGEIDILAEKVGRLHFVEVKTVSCESGREPTWHPVENLHAAKLRRITSTIYNYLSTFHVNREDWQIDAILIRIDQKSREADIEFFEALGG